MSRCAAGGCTSTRTRAVRVSIRLPELEHTEEGALREVDLQLCSRHERATRWQPSPGGVSKGPTATEVANEVRDRLEGHRR